MQIKMDYIPLPAAKQFHESPVMNKLGKGGKGSGKTEAMLREAQMLSFEFGTPNVGLLGRRTLGEIQEVLIDPLLQLTPDDLIAEYRKVDHKLIFSNGSIIYFRPLDEPTKFKGLNLGWFGVDEVDANSEEDWLQLVGQLRKPGVRHVAMATTNPTNYDHWVYNRWVKSQYPGYGVFTFRTRDNYHLPKDFYENLYTTMPESWVKRYLDGEWGVISLGDRVTPDFSEKLHVYDNLIYNPSVPVVRAFDFGLNGHAALFFQLRPPLGADFIGEVFRKDMTSQQFALVVARYSSELFPGAIFDDVGDIAGHHREATSGRSPIEVMSETLGTSIRTGQVPLRDSIDLLRVKLSQISGGTTALRFHPRMRLLIEALGGGYVFKKDRNGNVIHDVPASDALFEHVADAARYGIWDKFAYHRPEAKPIVLPPQEPTIEDTSW